jgi:hypothetical protein
MGLWHSAHGQRFGIPLQALRHGVSKAQTQARLPYQHSTERTAMLKRWTHHYNWHRPHQGIAGVAPCLGSNEPETTS